MSLFLDFLVIAVFALCVYTGVRYGFIRSVMSIVVLVLSLLGSIHFSPALSDYLQVNHIEPAVTKQAEKSVEALISGVDSMDLDRLFSESPEAFVNVIEKFGVDYEEVKEHFENRLSGAADSARELAHYIAEPLAEKISDAAAFAILFLGLLIVLTVVMLLINLFVKIPGLNGMNKSLGLIFGILKGALYAWGLSLVIAALLPHLAVMMNGKISEAVIEHTVVVKFLGSLRFF